MTGMTDRIWANSGDAHVLEGPDYLWKERLPADMADRMPRSERVDERTEIRCTSTASPSSGRSA